jgi:hypothetical protein
MVCLVPYDNLRTTRLAKNKSQEEQIHKGLDKLREAGLAIDGSAPDLVPLLKERFGKEKQIDLAVAFALGRVLDSTAVEALAEIEKQATDKETKKEIKRSFFKLGQRGLTIPHEEARENKPAPGLFSRATDIEAYMSAVDGGGGRLVWIAKPQPNHGLQVIQGMVNDRDGLLRVGGMHLRRKELRKMVQDIKERHNVSMISIPWEYADWMLYENYEKAKPRGQTGLENFHELRSVFANTKPRKQSHPIYQKLDAAQVHDGAWREQSRRLLDEPELRYWILTDDWVQAFVAQLQEAQTSRLVLNPLQKEERFAAIVREAVKALCSGENGRSFRRRMEDMALYFVETNRLDLAKLSLAVALQVGEGDPGPLDVSFLTGLMQKTFAFYMSQEKAKTEEEQSSLIIKP